MNKTQEFTARLKDFDSRIARAEADVAANQKVIDNLAPQKEACERECEEVFGVGIDGIDQFISDLEGELEQGINYLAEQIAVASRPETVNAN